MSAGTGGNPVPDPALLSVLICPVSRGALRYDVERGLLISERAGLAYPVRQGIPVMLPDAAIRWPDVGGSRQP